MATYDNDLRLKEIATGDEDGTWGVSTNTNLELIAEALGYGTQDGFASDADATTTVADGATDPARAMFFKVTSSATLSATRTLTIAPNTISRVMWVENATTGGQSITISQGSGGTVTIPNGDVKIVYLDGAGAGASVVDATANINFSDVNNIVAAVLSATSASLTSANADRLTGSIQALGSISGSQAINISTADTVTATITGATTFSVTNLVTGKANTLTLYLTNPGAGTITWPSGTTFNLSAAPTLPATGNTIIILETYDDGTTWKGIQAWRDSN